MPRTRKGFTLIELLIVVVIIGILAAIAIPKFANTKEKAYITQMKSDLKNLVAAQEAYFSDNNEYADNITALGVTGSTGVDLQVTSGDATGWTASATHPSVTSFSECTIAVGNGADPEGEPVCTP
jgi:prepilin-type N-terminal cleavage/methylation domain-containing protein